MQVNYVRDYGGYTRYLLAGEADGNEEGRALSNLDELVRRRKVGVGGLAGVSGVRGIVLDGHYESSLMLLDDFVEELEASFGRVAAAPAAADTLLVCPASDTGAVERLRALARVAASTRAHPITSQVFVSSAQGWRALECERN